MPGGCSAIQTFTFGGKNKVETQELGRGTDRPLLQIRENGFSIALDRHQWSCVRQSAELLFGPDEAVQRGRAAVNVAICRLQEADRDLAQRLEEAGPERPLTVRELVEGGEIGRAADLTVQNERQPVPGVTEEVVQLLRENRGRRRDVGV